MTVMTTASIEAVSRISAPPRGLRTMASTTSSVNTPRGGNRHVGGWSGRNHRASGLEHPVGNVEQSLNADGSVLGVQEQPLKLGAAINGDSTSLPLASCGR